MATVSKKQVLDILKAIRAGKRGSGVFSVFDDIIGDLEQAEREVMDEYWSIRTKHSHPNNELSIKIGEPKPILFGTLAKSKDISEIPFMENGIWKLHA